MTQANRPNMEASQQTVPFIKAYVFVMTDHLLTPAEKLVLFTVTRYWPEPSIQSNSTIAELCAFSESYVEKLIKRLEDKGYIKRGYAHFEKDGKTETLRAIVPLRFPKTGRPSLNWVEDPPTGGATDPPIGRKCPSNRPDSPRQSEDLLEMDQKENRDGTPPPLPAEGQAAASTRSKARVLRFATQPRRRRMSDHEFQERQKLVVEQFKQRSRSDAI